MLAVRSKQILSQRDCSYFPFLSLVYFLQILTDPTNWDPTDRRTDQERAAQEETRRKKLEAQKAAKSAHDSAVAMGLNKITLQVGAERGQAHVDETARQRGKKFTDEAAQRRALVRQLHEERRARQGTSTAGEGTSTAGEGSSTTGEGTSAGAEPGNTPQAPILIKDSDDEGNTSQAPIVIEDSDEEEASAAGKSRDGKRKRSE